MNLTDETIERIVALLLEAERNRQTFKQDRANQLIQAN